MNRRLSSSLAAAASSGPAGNPSVSAAPRPALAWLPALGWVGDGVVVAVVALGDPVGLHTACLDRPLGRDGRDHSLAPADQVHPSGLGQGLADSEVVQQ